MDKIERIETDLMYLTDKVNSLNETVTALQAETERLRKQNELLHKKMEELDQEDRPNRKPPHY